MRKEIFLFSLLLFSITGHAKDSIFSQTVNKFKNDSSDFGQFKYLGELNCLENKLRLKEKELIVIEYGSLFNHMEALPRLIEYNTLVRAFDLFEKQNKEKENKKEKGKRNYFEECFNLYNSNSAKKFYLSFISERSNFHTKDNYEFFDEEEFKQYMLDYLNMGKIDQCRVLDCIPEKKTK